MHRFTLLLLPAIGAIVLGSVYGSSVQAALNPGNAITIASDNVFQVNTFSLSGSIGSLLTSNASQPEIVTGRWYLQVDNGNVSAFSANLSMINANGSGYRTAQLSNLRDSKVVLHPNGTTAISGLLDVTENSIETFSSVGARISVVNLSAIIITLDLPGSMLDGQPIYGIADPPVEETVTASHIITEQEYGPGPDKVGNKFTLPRLPDPVS